MFVTRVGQRMIKKDKSTQPPTDKFGKAGGHAERNMAFYLRRAFAEAPDVFVFNDIRLERNGEVAQIDHLILHRFGFIIVESKSVVGKLTVNAQGEFARIFNGRPQGMQSPIMQARLQAELLSKLLNDNREQLRRKVLFGTNQAYFGEERFKVLVAVSDKGIIERQGAEPPELCKAEAVAERIAATIKNHEKTTGIGGFLNYLTADKQTAAQLERDHLVAFTPEELTAMCEFLLENDRPRSREPRQAARPADPAIVIPRVATTPDPAQVASVFLCKQCQGGDLLIAYGKYGYYFRCRACQGNTPIKPACTACGKKARLKKAGREFTQVCETCGNEAHFFTNLE